MSKEATRDAYGRALVALGHQYPDVVVMDADLSKSTKTAEFARVFPERFINAGIAEQNLMGMAAGLAAAGKTVFASTFAIFATGRAFEQVRNSLAYAGLNVKICATHAGVTVGEDGGSHQSVEDIALMRALPNMTVLVPSDGIMTEKMVELAYKTPGLFYIRLGRMAVPAIHPAGRDFQLGKGIEMINGTDVAVIACGIMTAVAMQAAEELQAEGIDVAVVDMPAIKPLDTELVLRMASRTGAIVTVEEHSIYGGLGSAVCETTAERHPVPVKRIGIMDQFGQSGSPSELLDLYGLNAAAIKSAVHELLKIKK